MVSLSPQATEKIRNILTDAVKSKRLPGLSFFATSADNELCSIQIGPRVFGDPTQGPLDEDSIFWICSLAKLIVSIAGLQLIDQGKIRLDTPAAQFLPELADPIVASADSGKFERAANEIKISNLFNHSSGLTYGLAEERPTHYTLPIPYTSSHNKDAPVTHFYSMLRGGQTTQPLIFEPGTSFAYGYGVDSLGFIVERISGLTLDQYCQKNIFSPLGISSTSFYLTPERKKSAVALNFRQEDGTITPYTGQTPVIVQDFEKVHLLLGGIGVYSSLKDYMKILQHLLQIKSGTAKHPILTTESVQSLFLPTLSQSAEKALNEKLNGNDLQWSTGLCLNKTDWPGKRRKGSGCWYGWAGTYYFVDPTTGVALLFGTQIIPTRDAELVKVWGEVEEAFYEGVST